VNKLRRIASFLNAHPLAKRHKLRAYYNVITWQLSQLLLPHEAALRFIGPTKLKAIKGLTGATGNIYAGLEDFYDMGFLLHFLREGDVFADIGSNIGSYSVLASGCCRAKTIAFEPISSSFSWLLKNIELNNLQGLITPFNMGIGSSTTELYFTAEYGTVNHVVADNEIVNENNILKVPVSSFDDISLTTGFPQLIKIDVEGFETEVIRGMKNTLQSDELKAIIIELNGSACRYGWDESLIHQHLLENHYFPYAYNPLRRELTFLQEFGSINTIYIRDLDFVKDRVNSAKNFTVFSESF